MRKLSALPDKQGPGIASLTTRYASIAFTGHTLVSVLLRWRCNPCRKGSVFGLFDGDLHHWEGTVNSIPLSTSSSRGVSCCENSLCSPATRYALIEECASPSWAGWPTNSSTVSSVEEPQAATLQSKGGTVLAPAILAKRPSNLRLCNQKGHYSGPRNNS